MQIYEISAIIFLAAAVHASFGLSVSMLSVMSGHALGKRTAARRVLNLSAAFALGVMTMIMLVVSLLALLATNLFPAGPPQLVWSAVCGLMVGLGVAVWVFYYRRKQKGTVLWLPRSMAGYLSRRSRATKDPAEAFGLGLSSVVAELLFTLAPMLLTALLLVRLDTPLQIVGLALYSLVAALPLLVITMLVGGGHSLGKIQRWREQNKRFLQFVAGSSLIILGGVLYVDTIMSQSLLLIGVGQ